MSLPFVEPMVVREADLGQSADAVAYGRACCKVTLGVGENKPAAGLYRAIGFGSGSAGATPTQYLFLGKRRDPTT